ncbi:serine threonine protein kinase, partial [Moniliophthora roreri]
VGPNTRRARICDLGKLGIPTAAVPGLYLLPPAPQATLKGQKKAGWRCKKCEKDGVLGTLLIRVLVYTSCHHS